MKRAIIKIIVISTSLLLSSVSALAQLTQRGRITEMSSGGRPVAGCEVLAAGAVPADSDNDGRFQLEFPAALPGDPMFGISIYKKGYTVVNADKLNNWSLSQTAELHIVIGRTEEIDRLRKKYYDIGMTESERRYRALLSELTHVRQRMEISEAEYQQKADSIRNEIAQTTQKINEFSIKFARIDRDALDAREKTALEFLDAGEMEKVIEVYESMNLEGELERRITVRDDAEEDLRTLLPSLIHNFRLSQEAGDTVRCDSLAAIISRSAERTADKLVPAEWYLKSGNTDKAHEAYALLANECKSLEDILLIEQSFISNGGQEEKHKNILDRIMTRKRFFTKKAAINNR